MACPLNRVAEQIACVLRRTTRISSVAVESAIGRCWLTDLVPGHAPTIRTARGRGGAAPQHGIRVRCDLAADELLEDVQQAWVAAQRAQLRQAPDARVAELAVAHERPLDPQRHPRRLALERGHPLEDIEPLVRGRDGAQLEQFRLAPGESVIK